MVVFHKYNLQSASMIGLFVYRKVSFQATYLILRKNLNVET